MANIIRILSKKQKPTFGETLEERARQLTGNLNQARRASLDSIVEQDIALTLDHIQRLRALEERLRRNLLRIECYIDTEIIQREPREPVYIDYRLAERDRLRNKLFKIEQERRTLAVAHREKMQMLHDRLLSLLHKRAHLTPSHGHRKDRP